MVHDLDEIRWQLDGTGARPEELTAQCPHCQARHTQSTGACPDCGVPVVWLHSRAWKKLHGSPEQALVEKPATPLQADIARRYGDRGLFAHATQRKEIVALERRYPESYIRELLRWAEGKNYLAFVRAVKNEENHKRWLTRNMPSGMVSQPVDDEPTGWALAMEEGDG